MSTGGKMKLNKNKKLTPCPFVAGERVYYEETGPEDAGTVIAVRSDFRHWVAVRWDAKSAPNDPEIDEYGVGQLKSLVSA